MKIGPRHKPTNGSEPTDGAKSAIGSKPADGSKSANVPKSEPESATDQPNIQKRCPNGTNDVSAKCKYFRSNLRGGSSPIFRLILSLCRNEEILSKNYNFFGVYRAIQVTPQGPAVGAISFRRKSLM